MSNKKKKHKRIKLPANAQEFYDMDYWEKLNDDEKQWYTEFMDGTIGNNCRLYSMFTERDDYPELSKQIYSETNSRNRDIYAKSRAGKRLLSIDFLSDTKEERYISKLLSNKIVSKQTKDDILTIFGIKDFEDVVLELIDGTVDVIKNQKNRTHLSTMLNFYVTLNTLIKEENRHRRSTK